MLAGVLSVVTSTAQAAVRPAPILDADRRTSVTPNRTARPFVIGGAPARDGFWRYVVEVRLDGERSCTGSLVSATQVLTAAHCAVDEDGRPYAPETFEVAAGSTDTGDPATFELHRVVGVRAHPAYSPITHDVAVLTLAAPTSLPAIRIATPEEFAAIRPGAELRVAGWGLTDPDATSGSSVLQEARLPMISDQACANAWPREDIVPAAMVCTLEPRRHDAFLGGTAVCSGDSGGPLVATLATGEAVLVGVTSFGTARCDIGIPDVFAQAPSYAPWIADPSRVEPPDETPLVPIDRAKPRLRLLPSFARRGGWFALRFDVFDNSGRTGVRVFIEDRRRRRLVISPRSERLANGLYDAAFYFPRALRGAGLRWCAVATDASGNTTGRVCRPLRFR